MLTSLKLPDELNQRISELAKKTQKSKKCLKKMFNFKIINIMKKNMKDKCHLLEVNLKI